MDNDEFLSCFRCELDVETSDELLPHNDEWLCYDCHYKAKIEEEEEYLHMSLDEYDEY
jgi:hypothetical protein